MQSTHSDSFQATSQGASALLPAHGPSARFHRPGAGRTFPLGVVFLAVFVAQFAIVWLGVMFFRAF